VGTDGHSESRYQVCLPQPARSLHEDVLLQGLDRKSRRHHFRLEGDPLLQGLDREVRRHLFRLEGDPLLQGLDIL